MDLCFMSISSEDKGSQIKISSLNSFLSSRKSFLDANWLKKNYGGHNFSMGPWPLPGSAPVAMLRYMAKGLLVSWPCERGIIWVGLIKLQEPFKVREFSLAGSRREIREIWSLSRIWRSVIGLKTEDTGGPGAETSSEVESGFLPRASKDKKKPSLVNALIFFSREPS